MNSKLITWSGYILLLLFALWHYFFCVTETITIVTPAIKGDFPAYYPKQDTIVIDNAKNNSAAYLKEIARLKKEYNFTQGEIDELATENEKISLFLDGCGLENDGLKLAIQNMLMVRELDERLEDDEIIINAKGIIRGELKRLKIDYEIKPKTIEVEIKKQKLSLFVGSQIGVNKALDQFTYKIDADLLTKNKIYKASYQQFNEQQFGLIGLSFKIF